LPRKPSSCEASDWSSLQRRAPRTP
jgi:hypothetical protein